MSHSRQDAQEGASSKIFSLLPCSLADAQVWINQGDIILLSLRDFQDDKADVIQKYTTDEARNLKAYGELPGKLVKGTVGHHAHLCLTETAKINETDTFGPEDEYVFLYRFVIFASDMLWVTSEALVDFSEGDSDAAEVDIDDI